MNSFCMACRELFGDLLTPNTKPVNLFQALNKKATLEVAFLLRVIVSLFGKSKCDRRREFKP